MKHVLITGGAGFIGSYLCDAFLERGYAVTAVDNLVTGSIANLESAMSSPEFQFVEANVSWPWDLSRMKFLERHGLEGVLHFASPSSAADAGRIPQYFFEANSTGTMKTAELALRFQARYILASGSEIYESGDPANPRSYLIEAKRFAEAFVSNSVRMRGLNAAIARIFYTYGPRMRWEDDRVVPEFVRRALQSEPLTIYGDGSQSRAFCYVSDLVAAILRLYESELRIPLDLGSSEKWTILELAQAVSELAGGASRINHVEARSGDLARSCPDLSIAREILGWKARVPLRQGLGNTFDHFRQLEAGFLTRRSYAV
jgi:dTDP-glucose 4,6-dehydratase